MALAVSSIAHRPGRVREAQRLSVIIPAHNEESRIGRVLAALWAAAAQRPWQVIVVDGRSTDATAQLAAAHGATVVTSQPGRGRQLNAGAAAATGDALLFLHADTLPPHRFDRHIQRVLSRPDVVAGAFTLRIDGPESGLRLIEKLVAWRCRARRMPYGDQGIFLKAQTLRDVGGFAELALMEDYELMCRLRRRGVIGISPARAVTSARRWQTGGVWRTTVMNQLSVLAFRLGVPAATIARWRQRRRSTIEQDSIPLTLPGSPRNELG